MNASSIIAIVTALGPLVQSLGGNFQLLSQVFGGLLGTGTPAVTNNNATKLLQEALNALQAAGKVQFQGQASVPGNSPLLVEGNFGGRTFAAVKAVQAAFGWTVEEPLASIEMNLIATLLSKLG